VNKSLNGGSKILATDNNNKALRQRFMNGLGVFFASLAMDLATFIGISFILLNLL